MDASGGISLDETSGAVASVLHEVSTGHDQEALLTAEEILPDMTSADFVAQATGTDAITEEQVVHEEIMFTEGDHEVQLSSGIGSDFFVGQNAVVQMQEEEIIETPSASETEMSVAMEMAKLSQGLISSNNSYDDTRYSDTENTTPPPSISDLTPECSPGEKPRLSYAQLIAEALMTRKDQMMTLSEIYQAISRKYDYYNMEVKSWQNAIRHNLTLNPSFSKIPRPSQEGRGNYWRMEPGSEKTIFRRQIRNHQYQKSKGEAKSSRKSKVVYMQQQVNQMPEIRTEPIQLETVVAQQSASHQQTTPTVVSLPQQHHIVVSSPVVSSAGGLQTLQKKVMIVQKSPNQSLNGQKIVLAGKQNIRIINQSGQTLQQQPTLLQNGKKNGNIVFIALPAKSKILKAENA